MPKTPPWKIAGGYWIELAIVLSAAALVASILYSNHVRNAQAKAQKIESVRRCEAINRLQGAVLTILVASKAALPANRFYVNHPHQLRAALRETQHDIDLVRRAKCLQ
jgi:hypothetical protein